VLLAILFERSIDKISPILFWLEISMKTPIHYDRKLKEGHEREAKGERELDRGVITGAPKNSKIGHVCVVI